MTSRYRGMWTVSTVRTRSQEKVREGCGYARLCSRVGTRSLRMLFDLGQMTNFRYAKHNERVINIHAALTTSSCNFHSILVISISPNWLKKEC